jgi:outer membrane protein TolC
MKKLAVILFFVSSSWCLAQQDTLTVLTRDALMQLVIDHHPAVAQAMLRDRMAEATERSARGAFDPRAVAGYEEKTFEGKLYHGLLDAGLRVPTWFGAELFAGIGEADGIFVDPQERTPEDGLLKAGVNLQLGQGLFIDRRRAEMRRAFAFREMAEGEKRTLLNDIFHEVLRDHVDWIAAYQRVQIGRVAVARAGERMAAVRGSFIGGDRPAIDTLEAMLQLQDRQMRLREAETGFQNATLILSNHLWDANMRPLELQPNVVPDTLDLVSPGADPDATFLVERALSEHPLLLELQGRTQQLEVERRLRSEMFKPQLDLNYALLSNGNLLSNEDVPRISSNDRQWGFNFSMPLLLRKERGEHALAAIRVTEIELAVERARQEIRTTIGRRNNDVALMRQQVRLGQEMVDNYRALYQGEYSKFLSGESSLFLVNQREVALVDGRLQQVEREARLRKAFFQLERDAGVLWRNYLAGEAR